MDVVITGIGSDIEYESAKMYFEEGISGVIKWVKDNWDEIQKEPLEYVHVYYKE